MIFVVAGALLDGDVSSGDEPGRVRPDLSRPGRTGQSRDRRVLIAERPAGKHMAGRWEFPGGKVVAGETESAALIRELQEELGVSVTACRPFMRLSHEYPDRVVELSLWLVDSFTGEPVGLEGQGLKWVGLQELGQEDILEADAPFVAALQKL